jgi:hypothetical protein
LNIQSEIKQLMNWGNPSALPEAGFFLSENDPADAAMAA